MKEPSRTRTAELSLRLSELEFPPLHDALILGKRAPVQVTDIQRWVNAVSPDQYEFVELDHPAVAGIFLRQQITRLVPRETLVGLLLEECGTMRPDAVLLRARVDVDLVIRRRLQLS